MCHEQPLFGLPIENLDLTRTQTSDAGASILARIKGLRELHLESTRVTPAAVADLKAALPDCKIAFDEPAAAVSGETGGGA